MGKQGIARRAGAAALAIGVIAGVLATSASGAGNKFEWTKNGNQAAAFWKSFYDDAAYMTVSGHARQRRGRNSMHVRVRFYSLRCVDGQNSCASVSAGGYVTIAEGAEWQFKSEKRLPDMWRRRGRRFAASEPVDPDSRMMQARIYLCYDRSVTPDPCSHPRYAHLTYTKD